MISGGWQAVPLGPLSLSPEPYTTGQPAYP